MSIFGQTYKSLSAEDRVLRAKSQLEARQPFFAYLLMNMRIHPARPEEKVATMQVDSLDNIKYNPEFILTMTEQELIGVLCHEVTHRILNHIPRMFSQQNHQIAAISADMLVNWLLVENDFVLSNTGYIPDKYSQSMKLTLDPAFDPLVIGDLGGKSIEELYTVIETHLKRQQNSKKCTKNGLSGGGGGANSQGGGKSKGGKGSESSNGDNSDGGGQGDPQDSSENSGNKYAESPDGFDSHVQCSPEQHAKEDPNDAHSSDPNELPEKWKDILAQAYNASKQRGLVPAGIESLMGDLLTPKIPWKQKLYRFITQELIQDFTWKRPHKKSMSLGIYLPNVYKEKIDMVLHIDTSGSISDELLTEFLTEIYSILAAFPQIEMTLLQCDAAIQGEPKVMKGEDRADLVNGTFKVKGRGGTSHTPVVDWINKNSPMCRLFISLTDGYSDIQSAYPSLSVPAHRIVLLPKACADVAKQIYEFAEVIYLDNSSVVI